MLVFVAIGTIYVASVGLLYWKLKDTEKERKRLAASLEHCSRYLTASYGEAAQLQDALAALQEERRLRLRREAELHRRASEASKLGHARRRERIKFLEPLPADRAHEYTECTVEEL